MQPDNITRKAQKKIEYVDLKFLKTFNINNKWLSVLKNERVRDAFTGRVCIHSSKVPAR